MVQNSLSNKKRPFDGKEAVSEKSTMQHVWTQVGITLAYLALVGFAFAMFHVAYAFDTLVLGLTKNVYLAGFFMILFIVVMEVFSFAGRSVMRWAKIEKYTWITIQIVAFALIILGGLAIVGVFIWKTAFIFYGIGGDKPDFATMLMIGLVVVVMALCFLTSAYKWISEV